MASRKPGISDADLAVLEPVYNDVRDILRAHRLGASLDDLAALVTLKAAAGCWKLVTEAAPELSQVPRG